MGNSKVTLTTEKAQNVGSNALKISRQIKYIRKREEIPRRYYSIKKILQHYDMELYANMCCDRIAEENKIDGEHVMIDFVEIGDILVDWIGVIKCEEIISAYITVKECIIIEELFETEQDVIDAENRTIRLLRSFSTKDINKVLKEKRIKEIAENTWNEAISLMKEELKARRIHNILKNRVQKWLQQMYVKIKYHRVISFLNSYSDKCGMEV